MCIHRYIYRYVFNNKNFTCSTNEQRLHGTSREKITIRPPLFSDYRRDKLFRAIISNSEKLDAELLPNVM